MKNKNTDLICVHINNIVDLIFNDVFRINYTISNLYFSFLFQVRYLSFLVRCPKSVCGEFELWSLKKYLKNYFMLKLLKIIKYAR